MLECTPKAATIDDIVHRKCFMEDVMRKLTWDDLCKNMVVRDDRMIGKKKCDVLCPEIGYPCYKEQF